jgi:hypothetical protein
MATHRANSQDWIQAYDGRGYPIPGMLEYVGPTTGWYMAPKWSEMEHFGDEDDVEPLNGVYVIRAVDSGRLKIGYSTQVYRRLSELRTASPERLELVCVLNTSEKHAHRLAMDYRIHGEWFEEEALEALEEVPRA